MTVFYWGRNLCYPLKGGYMGLRTDLGTSEKRRILASFGN